MTASQSLKNKRDVQRLNAKRQQFGVIRLKAGDKNGIIEVVMLDSDSGGSDLRRVGDIAQKMFEIPKEHEPNTGAQIVPILFAGTEFGTAILVPAVTQFQDLMNEKGQHVEHKKVVR